jgi:hypothetical protein
MYVSPLWTTFHQPCTWAWKRISKLFFLTKNSSAFSYWGLLDSAIRGAAFRGARVDLLISQWNHSRPEMYGYLRSMLAINNVLPLHVGGRRGKINVVGKNFVFVEKMSVDLVFLMFVG